jgi:hypothetical protein
MVLLLAGVLQTSGAAGADSPATPAAGSLTYEGGAYVLARVQKINNGWAVSFAPAGQDPDAAHEELIVDYLNAADAQGHAVTARQFAVTMLQQSRSRGATIIAPFATPDPANAGGYIYYATFYYVYPQDHNGDVWISRIWQSNDHVISLLYKHRIDGESADVIAASLRSWLKDNVREYGGALGRLAVPSEPPAPQAH